ncbi:MAG TPA: DHA2 family efflux MFS transporter permease subunit, partial [Gemmatimonadota bacterium]|nr:DHA2 family efflux MFS transporter permease subunit [Gemmatimonadota bacterium]
MHEVDYSQKWWVMLAIAMGVFLGTIDGSIVNVALPTLVADLDTTFPVVQWVVLAYLLTLATLVLGIGRLGDIVGKKPIYTWGFAVFTLGSVLCGLSPSVGWLIGFRVFQGIGAAMIFALGFAIITEAFPREERGRALGIQGAIVSVGIVLGPTLGGLLIGSLGWRWIFFVNLPVGIVGTITAIRYIPDVPPPGGERFDFVGAGAFLVMLLSVLLGLTFGQTHGFGHPLPLGLLGLAAVILPLYVTIERRAEHPMLDLSLFRNRLVSVNLFAGWASFAAIGGVGILLPFYLERVLGHSPAEMGLLLSSLPLGLGLAAPAAGSISDRIGPWPVILVGLATLLASYLLMLTLGTDTGALAYLATMLPVGLGMGIFQSPNNSAIMGAVPPRRLGVTSGLLTITRITGQLSGISILGAVWAARVAEHAGVRSEPSAAPAR